MQNENKTNQFTVLKNSNFCIKVAIFNQCMFHTENITITTHKNTLQKSEKGRIVTSQNLKRHKGKINLMIHTDINEH